jgi:hypothetical protein
MRVANHATINSLPDDAGGKLRDVSHDLLLHLLMRLPYVWVDVVCHTKKTWKGSDEYPD